MEKMCLVALCLVLAGFHQGHAATWGYTGTHGVSAWATDYPGQCDGQSQSPIDLTSSSVTYDSGLTAFSFTNFNSVGTTMTLSNNGHSAVVTVSGAAMTVTGGGLVGTFEVAQFHFHWGSVDGQGSEHTVDGIKYPLELHIVCYNKKYADLGTAVGNADGLAVLGFFYEVSPNNNGNMDNIISGLSSIVNANDQVVLTTIPLNDIMAGTSDFYRYSGGLTTPTCNEVVTWTVFRNTIKISASQLATFRTLKDSSTTPAAMVDNYRPVQNLNGRSITASFDHPNFNTAPALRSGAALGLVLLACAWAQL